MRSTGICVHINDIGNVQENAIGNYIYGIKIPYGDTGFCHYFFRLATRPHLSITRTEADYKELRLRLWNITVQINYYEYVICSQLNT